VRAYIFPCTYPIQYSVGTFDARFGVSKSDFLKAIDQASAIWEGTINRNLFTYNANVDELKVNLIYDERQLETQERSVLDTQIDAVQAQYNAKRTELAEVRQSYNAAATEYQSFITQFNQRAQAYVEQVEYWNKRGGAPKETYAQLQQEKNALSALHDTLEVKRVALIELSNQLRTVTDEVNALAREANVSIDVYNHGQFVGKEFDAGLYIQDTQGKRINIYQFETRDKLVRVLAHELGHALGLPHNDNPQSIMYALNSSSNEKPTGNDIASLKSVCRL